MVCSPYGYANENPRYVPMHVPRVSYVASDAVELKWLIGAR